MCFQAFRSTRLASCKAESARATRQGDAVRGHTAGEVSGCSAPRNVQCSYVNFLHVSILLTIHCKVLTTI